MIKTSTVERQLERESVNSPTIKPPKIATNIEWTPKSTGGDCRFVYYEEKRRRRRHLGHLTLNKLVAMPEAERLTKVQAWVSIRKALKGIN